MKQLQWAAMAVICIMMGMNVSCSHEMYDEDETKKYFDSVSPVDTVDANHNWILTKSRALMVQVPEEEGIRMVRILTANPRETGDAMVVGEAWASGGERVTMSITYPSTVSTLYAALVNEEGKYSIVRFAPEAQPLLGFDDLIVDHEGISYDPQPFQYTYCFEENYPAPGDYDYNDVVLRISQQRTGEREMRINVQLAAVGADNQVAAAIRLAGINYDDIEKVMTIDSVSFNRTDGKDLPNEMKMVVKKEKKEFYNSFLSRGIHNEAVINLFGDAHWATGDLLSVNHGMMTRKKYNVSKSVSTDNQQFVPRNVTYVVTFKSASGLNNLSMDQMDPFIIVMYNGGIFEVHQFIYREVQTLYNYTGSKIKNLPWALCIPKKDFRWALEGVNIGFIMRETHTYGAYQSLGHSFGEWAMDRTRAIDWYEYPTVNYVF